MLSPNFTPFPALQTERLLLRQLTLNDTHGVYQLRSNEDVMKYINRPLTRTLEEAAAWIKVVTDTLGRNDGITWCICLKEAPATHIGSIGLWRIEKENYRAELGYMLEPALQGKGIMHEALQAVIDYGFTILKLHSIEAQLDPRNRASSALLEKAGFVQEGHFRENVYHNGQFGDTAVYSLLTPCRGGANKEERYHVPVRSWLGKGQESKDGKADWALLIDRFI